MAAQSLRGAAGGVAVGGRRLRALRAGLQVGVNDNTRINIADRHEGEERGQTRGFLQKFDLGHIFRCAGAAKVFIIHVNVYTGPQADFYQLCADGSFAP